MMQNTIDNFLTPTKTPNQRARTMTVGTIDVPSKIDNQRELKYNNVSVNYIPDTGVAISVISEEIARMAGLEIKPFDKSRVK